MTQSLDGKAPMDQGVGGTESFTRRKERGRFELGGPWTSSINWLPLFSARDKGKDRIIHYEKRGRMADSKKEGGLQKKLFMDRGDLKAARRAKKEE